MFTVVKPYFELSITIPHTLKDRGYVQGMAGVYGALTLVLPTLIYLIALALIQGFDEKITITYAILHGLIVTFSLMENGWMRIWLKGHQKANWELSKKLYEACLKHNEIVDIMNETHSYLIGTGHENVGTIFAPMEKKTRENAETLTRLVSSYYLLDVPADTLKHYRDVVRESLGESEVNVPTLSIDRHGDELLQLSADLEMMELDVRSINVQSHTLH